MVRPAPSVTTQGENARLTCQVPRTNDFFMGPPKVVHFAWPSRIARQSRSGVAGISTWRPPRGETPPTSALATAGMAPPQPASPAPLTPSGLVLVGTGLLLTSTALISVARGMA